jgi:hypothetical protein
MRDPVIKSDWLRVMVYLFSLTIVVIIFGFIALAIVSAISGDPAGQFRFSGSGIFLISVYQSILLSGITALTIGFRKYIDKKDLSAWGFTGQG